MDDWGDDDPSGDRPHHKILAVEVEGGFLSGARLDFSDGLNPLCQR